MTKIQQSPSEKVLLGLIGAEGGGKHLMTEFKKDPSANFKAICDAKPSKPTKPPAQYV